MENKKLLVELNVVYNDDSTEPKIIAVSDISTIEPMEKFPNLCRLLLKKNHNGEKHLIINETYNSLKVKLYELGVIKTL